MNLKFLLKLIIFAISVSAIDASEVDSENSDPNISFGASMLWGWNNTRNGNYLKDYEKTGKESHETKEISSYLSNKKNVNTDRRESAEGKTKALIAVIAGQYIHYGQDETVNPTCYDETICADEKHQLYGHFMVLKLTVELAKSARAVAFDSKMNWDAFCGVEINKTNFADLEKFGDVTQEAFRKMFNYVHETHQNKKSYQTQAFSIDRNGSIVDNNVLLQDIVKSIKAQENQPETVLKKFSTHSAKYFYRNKNRYLKAFFVFLVYGVEFYTTGKEPIYTHFAPLLRNRDFYSELFSVDFISLDNSKKNNLSVDNVSFDNTDIITNTNTEIDVPKQLATGKREDCNAFDDGSSEQTKCDIRNAERNLDKTTVNSEEKNSLQQLLIATQERWNRMRLALWTYILYILESLGNTGKQKSLTLPSK